MFQTPPSTGSSTRLVDRLWYNVPHIYVLLAARENVWCWFGHHQPDLMAYASFSFTACTGRAVAGVLYVHGGSRALPVEYGGQAGGAAIGSAPGSISLFGRRQRCRLAFRVLFDEYNARRCDLLGCLHHPFFITPLGFSLM